MRNTLALCIVLVSAMAMVGCDTYYDASSVNAFLQTPRDSVVSATEYRTLPPDVISISSRTIKEIEGGASQQIRPDGKVNLPLVGEIYVAGKTPNEIEQVVAEAYTDYYEQTDASVNIVGYNSQRFYVFGQVGSPGPKRWTGRDALLDVLAAAQPTRMAWPERIWLVRGDSPQVGGQEWPEGATGSSTYRLWGVHPEQEGNPRHRMLVNLTAMYENGDLSQNVLLKPNDIIYVQPNPFAKVGLALQNVLFPVSPIVQAGRAPAQIATAGSVP
ncbi:MAG: polysaccharide biosynthesis/export family protein [Phycisphaerae bacterium]